MARLPVPGSDDGSWGDILNDFLAQSLNSDGTLKDDAVGGLQGQPVSSTTPTNNQVLTYNAGAGQWEPQTSAGGYTDEMAQDAVGAILADTSTVNLTYNDGTPDITADVIDDSITYAKIQNVSATDRVLGRSTAGAGNIEEITLTAAGRNLIDDADTTAQRATLGLTIGSDVQAFDADLVALAGLGTTGLLARTGAGTAASRTITGTSNRITVTNGDGVSGNPTLDIGTDVVTLTGSQTLTNKTLTTPTIGDFTNAQHAHTSAATGGTLTSSAVGLGNVDNTSDANKPISTATQAALDQKGVLAYNAYTSSTTWNRPTGAKVVEVFVIGGGGGGGKGGTAASGVARLGGGGGAAGGVVVGQFDATTLTSSVAVTVGAGGTAGTDPASTGGAGGASSFGSYVSASGGAGGGGGTFVFGPFGGSPGATSLIVGSGGTGATGTFANSGTSGHVGGGAPGRSIDASNAPNAFVGAGGSSPAGSGGASSTSQGGVGTAGANGSGTNGGSGAGGGGSHTTDGSSGGAGGAGGANGGGGAGGGAGTGAGVGGNGGTGGAGAVIVITYG